MWSGLQPPEPLLRRPRPALLPPRPEPQPLRPTCLQAVLPNRRLPSPSARSVVLQLLQCQPCYLSVSSSSAATNVLSSRAREPTIYFVVCLVTFPRRGHSPEKERGS